MTTAINVNETSERELTSDELNTVSGGASARAADQDWSPGGGGPPGSVLNALFGVLSFLH
jgi:hypothetical protein